MPSSSAFAKYPEHKITLAPHVGLVRVLFNGCEVAHSTQALKMLEGNYSAVFYLPINDCRMEYFTRTSHTTFCPFKGTASYWTLEANSISSENAAWAYQEPYDEMAEIAGHVAFYADKVEIQIT